MKQVIFNKIQIKNFLSIGNEPVEISFKSGLNVITGINLDKEDSKNGVGKCLDPSTEVNIIIKNKTVLAKFKKFIKKLNKLKTTIKQIANFYKEYPEYKGMIYADTRFGYKSVMEADITAKDEEVYIISTKNKELKGSKNHLLFSNKKWKKIKELNPGEYLDTKNGKEKIVDIKSTNIKKDLYDLQIDEVKEFYANGIVSHNSSIADALFFTLFGKTIRSLRKEQIINNINKKNCRVMLSFDVIEDGTKNEYIIVRSIQPTKTQLFKNEIDITKSSIPKTTAQICKIISSTPEVFENSVIMTVNNIIPFMAQKKVDKRKFIEGILQLGVFGEMLLLARQDYNDFKRDYDIEQTKVNEIQKTHSIYIEQQNKQIQQKENRIKELTQRSNNNTNEINHLTKHIKIVTKSQIEKYKENIRLLTKKEKQCQSKIKRTTKTILTQEAKIEQNKNRIKELTELGDVCVTCKRPFKTGEKSPLISERRKLKDKNKQIVIKIKNYKKELKTQEDIKEKCQNGINTFKNKINETDIKQRENDNIRSKIKQLQTWNKQIDVDIKKLHDEHNEFSDLIHESQIRLDVLNKQLQKIKTKLSNLDVIKFIVSEEGVKSFIVKKILKVLNGKLLYYLKELDANCLCKFNEYFEETILNDKGQECSYHNFSGGERRRIDLAMLFTFMDIRRLQADVQLNISFYDEILDTSLDNKGIESLLKILNHRIEKYKEAIYIMSHKRSAIKAATNDVVFLEKKNGFTSIVKYDNILNKKEK